MIKDDVIRLAEQAGMTRDGEMWFSNGWKSDMDVEQKHLEAFAKLVAEHEREACAKVCEGLNLYGGSESRQLQRATLKDCAYAIRARGQA